MIKFSFVKDRYVVTSDRNGFIYIWDLQLVLSSYPLEVNESVVIAALQDDVLQDSFGYGRNSEEDKSYRLTDPSYAFTADEYQIAVSLCNYVDADEVETVSEIFVLDFVVEDQKISELAKMLASPSPPYLSS